MIFNHLHYYYQSIFWNACWRDCWLFYQLDWLSLGVLDIQSGKPCFHQSLSWVAQYLLMADLTSRSQFLSPLDKGHLSGLSFAKPITHIIQPDPSWSYLAGWSCLWLVVLSISTALWVSWGCCFEAFLSGYLSPCRICATATFMFLIFSFIFYRCVQYIFTHLRRRFSQISYYLFACYWWCILRSPLDYCLDLGVINCYR